MRKVGMLQRVSDKFILMDAFGYPVNLTFDGEPRYRTHFGAFLTTMLGIFMIGNISFSWRKLLFGGIDDKNSS